MSHNNRTDSSCCSGDAAAIKSQWPADFWQHVIFVTILSIFFTTILHNCSHVSLFWMPGTYLHLFPLSRHQSALTTHMRNQWVRPCRRIPCTRMTDFGSQQGTMLILTLAILPLNFDKVRWPTLLLNPRIKCAEDLTSSIVQMKLRLRKLCLNPGKQTFLHLKCLEVCDRLQWHW